mmetsp:Transcript_1540/g.5290  ORF Transcript_1540/g.5290 Transcript_1540/m.5290 type:complete len:249 (-) Transcript_1540:176-922(-)
MIFSFGTTISESTVFSTSLRASLAIFHRRAPSHLNGVVTTATVRMPFFLHSAAITGNEPVPVPPPAPAKKKTQSTPSTMSINSLKLSSAAFRPFNGRPPAPKPRHVSRPIWNRLSHNDLPNACASVFTTISSTSFLSKDSPLTKLSTALPPAPPRPQMRILHWKGDGVAIWGGEVRGLRCGLVIVSVALVEVLKSSSLADAKLGGVSSIEVRTGTDFCKGLAAEEAKWRLSAGKKHGDRATLSNTLSE